MPRSLFVELLLVDLHRVGLGEDLVADLASKRPLLKYIGGKWSDGMDKNV